MEGGLAVAEASHSGSSEFGITLEGKEAPCTDSREYTLSVVAGGSWDLATAPCGSAEAPPVSFSGAGSEMVGPVDVSQEGSASISHDSQFAVAATFCPQSVQTAAPLFQSFGEFERDRIYDISQLRDLLERY